MKTAHTPGPWEMRDHKIRTLKISSNVGIHSGLNTTVALMTIGGFNVEADARLMAAAPELLKQLQHLVRLLTPCEQDGTMNVPGLATLNGPRAAIAKATGGDS